MSLLDEGFDQVGHASCTCVEEAEPTLFDLSVEKHRCGFEEQVLGDPLLDGGLDVVDILGPEVDDCGSIDDFAHDVGIDGKGSTYQRGMAACFVPSNGGSDFFGQLITVECSCSCGVSCKENP